eukprot:SAG31_NODE_4351_length_3323_cov_2.160360_1_plen_434_part_00
MDALGATVRRTVIATLTFTSLVGLVVLVALRPVFLQKDEQLLLVGLTTREVINGPCVSAYVPILKPGQQRKAVLLDELSYVIVTDTLAGVQRTVEGPQLFFPGAYESAGLLLDRENFSVQPKVVLLNDEYLRLQDSKTGEARVVTGPRVLVPQPTEQWTTVEKGIKLEKDEYLKLADVATGRVRVLIGEQIVFPAVATEQAVVLPTPKVFDPFADGGEVNSLHRPGRHPGVQPAVKVDHDMSVLLLDRESGEQRLVTDHGNLFPSAMEEVLEVRKVIFVQPHEVVVVSDTRDGNLTFHSGSTEAQSRGLAFFLPPHCELLTMYWGSGTSPEDLANNIVSNHMSVKYKVPVIKIDTRAQYAFFAYGVRTNDNVELTLEGTIFWQVVDVPLMISKTSDPKSDVWYHSRSALIQAVSNIEGYADQYYPKALQRTQP